MLVIIDYGMGNLRSVEKAFETVGVPVQLTNDPEVIKAAPGIVLPGVGAFSAAMKNLNDLGLVEPLKEAVVQGKPFLGICLGMHLLLEGSEEGEPIPGLGLIPGWVKKLPPGLKVPHMGWNQIHIKKETPILKGIQEEAYFYFVHSYYCDPEGSEMIATSTDYGIDFTSIIAKGNVFGIQFHPEKSSSMGLQILKNFGGLVE